jgi:predicted acyl esterase
MQYASPEARAKHYLIVGPWDHAGTRTPNPEVGGLKFAASSTLDLNALHKAWYDWTMKGGPKPDFLEKPVAYFVTGVNEGWIYADSLDAVATATRTLYLASDGGASDAFHSGSLVDAKPAGVSKPDVFTYDPLDTRPSELQRAGGPNYLTDQTAVMNLFGDGVIYHSAPFAEDTEKLVVPGQVLPYTFDTFTWFSRRVAKGSRLRLVVSCPNTIYLEKNYNSGKPVADETAADARTAHVMVYHDAEHPSAVELPVVRR